MGALPPLLTGMQEQLLRSPSKESAWAIIKEYFSFFGVKGAERDLWAMLVASLTHEEVGEGSARYRLDKIFFYEFTLMLMQAVSLLNEEKNKETAAQKASAPETTTTA